MSGTIATGQRFDRLNRTASCASCEVTATSHDTYKAMCQLRAPRHKSYKHVNQHTPRRGLGQPAAKGSTQTPPQVSRKGKEVAVVSEKLRGDRGRVGMGAVKAGQQSSEAAGAEKSEAGQGRREEVGKVGKGSENLGEGVERGAERKGSAEGQGRTQSERRK